MAQIYVTRMIPQNGIDMLKNAGHEVDVNPFDRVLTKSELITAVSQKPYSAVLCLLTDAIDGEVMDNVPTAKIFSNYAVGFNNITLADAASRGVTITNTPGVLTHTVAEHAVGLMLSLTSRITEGDRFMRAGKYEGWAPLMLLGTDLRGKTFGLLGAGRIGFDTALMVKHGFGMNLVYYDVMRNVELEAATGALFCASIEEVLGLADVVSLHAPLLDSTRHLMNAKRLALMKPTAYLINTSRGPLIDEAALVEALKKGTIAGAGLDVFENEPALTPGLAECENVVLTPHIASATTETRGEMAAVAAQAILDALAGKVPQHVVK
jgi:lactate dehydrogenase-like 2-hydroxyacid dehydrogenase